MKITSEQMNALTTAFRTEFEKGKSTTENLYDKIVTTVPSTSATNFYGWLGEMPNMREWVGDRIIKEISAHGYTITNKSFESSVGVAKTAIEDDTIGIYKPLMQEMGRLTSVHPNQLVFQLLAQGHVELCYDEKPFFSKEHLVGEAKVSNFDEVANGKAWYLLDCSRPLKPIIFQERKKGQFTAMTKPDDESVFLRNEFRYGVDCRCNVGFGFWQMAHCSQKSLTEANFESAYTAMRSLLNESGNPLGIRATHIVVPPSLHSTALTLMAQTKANGASNALFNRVQIIEADWLLTPVAPVAPVAPVVEENP